MERFICIHGHFYQPPRENPWLEAIPVQPSAAPFRDWNQRIQAECYAPNGACRVRRDFQGPVTSIVNNYERISFNFGPTLLDWMKPQDPEAYQRILDADAASQERFSGHGNALAQGYNHMILPLSNSRDLETQIFWGIRDFQTRYRRMPEGIWLPETGVDHNTLFECARQGIRYVLLAPNQAKAVRKCTTEELRQPPKPNRRWSDVSGGRIDPTVPYLYRFADGSSIQLFFYDGPLSSAIAFQGLLNDGREFGRRLVGALRRHNRTQLVHVATDGESYGHHHRFGEMALAAALTEIELSGKARLTNYGEFLDLCPPQCEVQIHDPSAWSCAHGVGRWSEDCGCRMGTPGYHQRWRRPLRRALDLLRDGLDEVFESEAPRYLRDPWGARNAYVDVLLDGSRAGRENFLGAHGRSDLTEAGAQEVWKLLEMQRHRMFMYTSCGWFFDELGGIEGVQILRYGARALELGESFGYRGRKDFLEALAEAPSNVEEDHDGARIFATRVLADRVEPDRLVARYAIHAVLDPEKSPRTFPAYSLEVEDSIFESAGHARLLLGKVRLRLERTQEIRQLHFAVLHFGEHDFTCKVAPIVSPETTRAAQQRVLDAFRTHSLKESVLALEEAYPGGDHDLADLFDLERKRLVEKVLEASLEALAKGYEGIYMKNQKLMRFLAEMHLGLPEELSIAARYVLTRRLRSVAQGLAHARGASEVDTLLSMAVETLTESQRLGLDLSLEDFARGVQKRLEAEAEALSEGRGGGSIEICRRLVELAQGQHLPVVWFRTENHVFRFLSGPIRRLRERVDRGESALALRVERAEELGRALGFEVPIPSSS